LAVAFGVGGALVVHDQYRKLQVRGTQHLAAYLVAAAAAGLLLLLALALWIRAQMRQMGGRRARRSSFLALVQAAAAGSVLFVGDLATHTASVWMLMGLAVLFFALTVLAGGLTAFIVVAAMRRRAASS
jgi:hypothetical protein